VKLTKYKNLQVTTSTRYVRLLVTVGQLLYISLIIRIHRDKTRYHWPIKAPYPWCVFPYRVSMPDGRASIVTISSPCTAASSVSGCEGRRMVRRKVPLPCVIGRRGKGSKALVPGTALGRAGNRNA
jgi:membrane-associated phospholipid phosphatase